MPGDDGEGGLKAIDFLGSALSEVVNGFHNDPDVIQGVSSKMNCAVVLTASVTSSFSNLCVTIS